MQLAAEGRPEPSGTSFTALPEVNTTSMSGWTSSSTTGAEPGVFQPQFRHHGAILGLGGTGDHRVGDLAANRRMDRMASSLPDDVVDHIGSQLVSARATIGNPQGGASATAMRSLGGNQSGRWRPADCAFLDAAQIFLQFLAFAVNLEALFLGELSIVPSLRMSSKRFSFSMSPDRREVGQRAASQRLTTQNCPARLASRG